ncbi:MAG: phosphoenolpyruvate carboxykinase (ATP) [Polyangiaceae bacterium]
MSQSFSLAKHGITVTEILRNASPARLYEIALQRESGSAITSSGALVALSGAKTGRSPKDKRIMEHPDSEKDIWWGPVNIKLTEHIFLTNRERAIDYLNTRDHLYCVDGFAGWDPKYRIKVRVICARAYHALFMWNMLIRPTTEELEEFGEPDYVIFNGGGFPANRYTSGMTSTTSVDLSFERREFVILGSEYAGEMKKGVFTIMNYLMPKAGLLSMHCSATEGAAGDVSVLFGLSGTGKTTLSADPKRKLIGDDEHVWSADGVFNIEGGCYAKAINLSEEAEPDIFRAIRFGSVLENVVFDSNTRKVDYTDVSITDNTRCSYPIEFIPNAKLPCVAGHPNNVIFLTCDAFGVLPPVSKLTNAQAMYHFISGYTAKVAGTEVGVTEPSATFSACFGQPFIVWHPTKYAELLGDLYVKHNAQVWLVNTGWSGGPTASARACSSRYTRAVIDAIYSGELKAAPTVEDPIFELRGAHAVAVPSEILIPRNTWTDKAAYDAMAKKLAVLFNDNFKKYADLASEEVRRAGPRLWQVEGERAAFEGAASAPAQAAPVSGSAHPKREALDEGLVDTGRLLRRLGGARPRLVRLRGRGRGRCGRCARVRRGGRRARLGGRARRRGRSRRRGRRGRRGGRRRLCGLRRGCRARGLRPEAAELHHRERSTTEDDDGGEQHPRQRARSPLGHRCLLLNRRGRAERRGGLRAEGERRDRQREQGRLGCGCEGRHRVRGIAVV